ncbi:MAG: hypothetical protein GXO82_04410 [Chlorobi bacterium]|nr:hypothetical protein [Chlorobiota bacterium]
MSEELTILMVTAASIGFFHTITGPDHYLPFIVMAKARNWSRTKTTWITIACGVGHVGSSVILGLVGIALGIGVSRLEMIEAHRGDLAAWGFRRASRNKPHTHTHLHLGGQAHEHEHTHQKDHTHVHEGDSVSITPWVLFTIFVLGPCEPLIPLLMYPAATASTWAVAYVALVFGVVTISTMLGMVILATTGLQFLPWRKLNRFSHALAGSSIFLCGIAIAFLGL